MPSDNKTYEFIKVNDSKTVPEYGIRKLPSPNYFIARWVIHGNVSNDNYSRCCNERFTIREFSCFTIHPSEHGKGITVFRAANVYFTDT